MPLNIIVCIKAVVTDMPTARVVRTVDSLRLNLFDLPALETALQLRETHGGKVTVLSLGPPQAQPVLKEALAMGADRAVLVSDPAAAGSDTLATANALAAALSKLAPFDVVLFGTRTCDSDTGQVGPQTATIMNIPVICGVTRLAVSAQQAEVVRLLDQLVETYAVDLPAAFTIHPEGARSRDIGLMGLAAAFDAATVESWTIADLGLVPAQVGDAGSPTRVLSMQTVKRDRQCEFISAQQPEQQADELMRRLVEAGLVG